MRELLSLTEACLAVASIGHPPPVSISTRLVSCAPCFGLQMREWLSLTEACLAVASIGHPPLVSIGTRLFRLLRASVRRCGNGFLFSQRPIPVSLWNEVPLTLIARRCPCRFFLSKSKGMLDVKDTVLRRELASIALAKRKTKNIFRGMLSAFRAGERNHFAS